MLPLAFLIRLLRSLNMIFRTAIVWKRVNIPVSLRQSQNIWLSKQLLLSEKSAGFENNENRKRKYIPNYDNRTFGANTVNKDITTKKQVNI